MNDQMDVVFEKSIQEKNENPMMIDFKQAQIQQFEKIVQHILAAPAEHLDFQQVGDFYQSDWLKQLPPAAHYVVSGLDDGGEMFDIKIVLYGHMLSLSYAAKMTVHYQRPD